MRLCRTESHCNSRAFLRCLKIACFKAGFWLALRYTENQPHQEIPLAHTTPLSRSKTAALSRVLDNMPKGYTFYTAGECHAGKAMALLRKFHERYGIGCTPAERLTRKSKGLANALLALFWPDDEQSGLKLRMIPDSAIASPFEVPVSSSLAMVKVNWLLLATDGSGPVHEMEMLRSVLEKPRLSWLGYELIRHPVSGKTVWTWRRSKDEMEMLYRLLNPQLGRYHFNAVSETLERIARQPGFAGVRAQSWKLCEYARQHGFDGPLPHLFYVQKVNHGERVRVDI